MYCWRFAGKCTLHIQWWSWFSHGIFLELFFTQGDQSDGQTIQSDGECSERTANTWDTTSKPTVVESETRWYAGPPLITMQNRSTRTEIRDRAKSNWVWNMSLKMKVGWITHDFAIFCQLNMSSAKWAIEWLQQCGLLLAVTMGISGGFNHHHGGIRGRLVGPRLLSWRRSLAGAGPANQRCYPISHPPNTKNSPTLESMVFCEGNFHIIGTISMGVFNIRMALVEWCWFEQ